MFLNKMKLLLIAFLIAFICYSGLAWSYLSINPSRPILTVISEDSSPYIPTAVAKLYLQITDYKVVNSIIDNSPAFAYLTFKYDLEGFKNSEIMWLTNKFINAGADVNSRYYGYTTLQNAILANSPELVRYLLNNGANTKLLTQSKTAEFCQEIDSYSFAKCIHSLEKTDMSVILQILSET